MYQHYESRERPGRGVRLLRLLVAFAVVAAIFLAAFVFLTDGGAERPVSETDGVKQVSTVKDAKLAVYDGNSWETRFWSGMNLGDTLPGHAPGELAPTREDYMRWFPQMKAMNVDVLRVYTILEPEFYEALSDYNAGREEPLWLIHGIWSPEEELTGERLEGHNAYEPHITQIFENEISDAVHVVHGDANLPERRGHASGRYRADVSEYMLGWIVGTEWFPYAVKKTDVANKGMDPFSGRYFRATPDATPFESWCASMLDRLAKEEMKYGWQHPVAISNWPTTDPLRHPDEASEQEDLAPVDPMRVEPTGRWKAGYFASYHIYPAFPDFMRYQKEYQNYRTPEGIKDPYAGYLHELRAHHEGIPIVVAEYGTSSSRGMAHRGALGRNQGHHTEEAQGRINADLIKNIHREGYAGGILFSWQDEWFKFAWNTSVFELPSDRRPMWLNRLTNEQNYGVIATEPGESVEETIHLDGKTDDWDERTGWPEGPRDAVDWVSDYAFDRIPETRRMEYEDLDVSVSRDEAYLYLLAKKREGEWDLSEEELDVGLGTLPGGSEKADKAPGVGYPGGIQFLLQIKGKEDSHLWINSAYDPHTWRYGVKYDFLKDPVIEKDPKAGVFLPWRLALNYPLIFPQTKRKTPFEQYEVGKMKPGISDPRDPRYNSLADWYAEGDVLEVRIPWTMLGYTDPSSLRVWDYPYKANGIDAVKNQELRVYPTVRRQGKARSENVEPLSYSWEGWDVPIYHERKKKSYATLSRAFEAHDQVVAPPR